MEKREKEKVKAALEYASTPVRVLLVDNRVRVRRALRPLFSLARDKIWVREMGNAKDAIRWMERHHPDIVIIHAGLLEKSRLDSGVKELMKTSSTQIMMVVMDANAEVVIQAVRVGVLGSLVQCVDNEEVESAFQKVKRRNFPSPCAPSTSFPGSFNRNTNLQKNGRVTVTPRQLDILKLLDKGRSTTQIAQSLHVSGKTIEAHLTRLKEQWKIHSVAGLVRFAIRKGLLPPI